MKSKMPPLLLLLLVALLLAGRALSASAFTAAPSFTANQRQQRYRRHDHQEGPTPSTSYSSQQGLLLATDAATAAEPRGRLIRTFDGSDFAGSGDWPYAAADVERHDASDDALPYRSAQMIKHVDERAIEKLTRYYRQELGRRSVFGKGVDVLDLGASWSSWLPEGVHYGRVAGVGMNAAELQANPRLTEFAVRDLNRDPSLGHLDDGSFDVIGMVLSVDYLTKPREVFREMHRVLRPGGAAYCSFSNPCNPRKSVAVWRDAGAERRLEILASYFYYSGEWTSIEGLDLMPPQYAEPEKPSVAELFQNPGKFGEWRKMKAAVEESNNGDPMFMVKAIK